MSILLIGSEASFGFSGSIKFMLPIALLIFEIGSFWSSKRSWDVAVDFCGVADAGTSSLKSMRLSDAGGWVFEVLRDGARELVRDAGCGGMSNLESAFWPLSIGAIARICLT